MTFDVQLQCAAGRLDKPSLGAEVKIDLTLHLERGGLGRDQTVDQIVVI